MRYETVIFDLDGTLLNTLDDLADSVNCVLNKYGYNQRSTSEIRSFVGNGIYKLIERSLPQNVEENVLNCCYETFSEYYKLNMMNKTKPYEGVDDLLDALKASGIKTAVVTNKADFAAQKLCKKFFRDKIDVIIGINDKINNKPAPDGVFSALKKLDAKAENSVYIGDSDVDAQTSVNAGLDFMAVLWGFRDLSSFSEYRPEYIAKTVADLKRELLKNI